MSETMNLLPNTMGKALFGSRDEIEKHNLHIILKGNDAQRLDKLCRIVSPTTKKQAIVEALALLDAVVNEYYSESTFYIKRKGKDIEEYDMFEER